MSILISCIGGSDPIRSFHDGPLLNIVRYHKDINKCYMFLSTEVKKIHNDTNKDYYQRAFSEVFNDRNIEYIYIPLNIYKVNDFDK